MIFEKYLRIGTIPKKIKFSIKIEEIGFSAASIEKTNIGIEKGDSVCISVNRNKKICKSSERVVFGRDFFSNPNGTGGFILNFGETMEFHATLYETSTFEYLEKEASLCFCKVIRSSYLGDPEKYESIGVGKIKLQKMFQDLCKSNFIPQMYEEKLKIKGLNQRYALIAKIVVIAEEANSKLIAGIIDDELRSEYSCITMDSSYFDGESSSSSHGKSIDPQMLLGKPSILPTSSNTMTLLATNDLQLKNAEISSKHSHSKHEKTFNNYESKSDANHLLSNASRDASKIGMNTSIEASSSFSNVSAIKHIPPVSLSRPQSAQINNALALALDTNAASTSTSTDLSRAACTFISELEKFERNRLRKFPNDKSCTRILCFAIYT